MFRLKMLIGLAGVFAVLAVSAMPASAWWQSKQSQGNINVITSGEFKYGNPTQASVSCPVEGIKAQWHIQTKGQIKQQQQHTTFGPHLAIQVKEWGTGCRVMIGVSEFKVEVKPCELQLVQQKESLTATGGVVTPCLIKIGEPGAPLCVVQIPAGMEKQPGSNEGVNVGLLETALSIGSNQLDKVLTKGILAYSVGGNGLCTLTHSTTSAELKGLEFEAEGAEAV